MSEFRERCSRRRSGTEDPVVVYRGDIVTSIYNVPIGVTATRSTLATKYRMGMLAYRAAEATGQAFLMGILKDHLQLIKQVYLLKHQVPLNCEQLDPIDEEDVIELIKVNKWGTLDDDAEALKGVKPETTTSCMSNPVDEEDKPSSDEKPQSCSGQICEVSMETETTGDVAEAPKEDKPSSEAQQLQSLSGQICEAFMETETTDDVAEAPKEDKPSSEAQQLQSFSQICEASMVTETTVEVAEAPKDETETATTIREQSKAISEVEQTQSYNFLNWEAFIDETPLKEATTSTHEPLEISRGETQASEATIVTTILARPSLEIKQEASSLDHSVDTRASEATTITTISAGPSIVMK